MGWDAVGWGLCVGRAQLRFGRCWCFGVPGTEGAMRKKTFFSTKSPEEDDYFVHINFFSWKLKYVLI